MIKPHIKPGVTTLELDTICHDYIVNVQNAIPACLGYGAAPGRPAFQHTICTSVNHVVCHGIPSENKILKKGDILNIDVTVIKDGFHGDTNMMYIVGGETSILANRLCKVAQEAMYRGMAVVKPGATIGDIGHAIQKYVESERFSVVREYCGHGIGTTFHDEPQVLHYGQPDTGMVLEEGMFSVCVYLCFWKCRPCSSCLCKSASFRPTTDQPAALRSRVSRSFHRSKLLPLCVHMLTLPIAGHTEDKSGAGQGKD